MHGEGEGNSQRSGSKEAIAAKFGGEGLADRCGMLLSIAPLLRHGIDSNGFRYLLVAFEVGKQCIPSK